MASMHFLFSIVFCSAFYFSQEVIAVSDCGGLIEETNGTITSPLYPSAYPLNQSCTWEIKMPLNNFIGLHFTHFDVEPERLCAYDSVTVKSKMKDGSIQEHGKFCGKGVVRNITSFSSILLIEFKSDQEASYHGFNVEFFSVSTECGGLVEGSEGVITSPLYPYQYPPDMNCTWTIQAPLNHIVKLNFEDFETVVMGSRECDYDHVTVQSNMTDGEIREHGKFCGTELPPIIFSDSNTLRIQFKSHASRRLRGFKATFTAISIECGGVVEGSEGVITSPLYPYRYPPDMNCTWNIQAPLNHVIKLKFSNFETVESSECDYDNVTVQSKMTDGEIREHGKFCGRELPPIIFSESNTLQIQFKSHSRMRLNGFKATFTTSECGGLIEGSKGNISSPFFTDLYPPNRMCEWILKVPIQHKIKLYFLHFNIEDGDGCPNDFLQIQSKSTDGEISGYGKYCGSSTPSLITTTNSLLLKFVSDRSVQRKGFKVEYLIDKLTDFESFVSLEGSTKPVYEPHYTTVNQNEVITTEFVTSANEESAFVALEILTNKVAAIEDRQKQLFNDYQNMFNNYKNMFNISRLLTPKDASLDEKNAQH